MKKVKVSVIMGIYNCESTLEESIKSLLVQTYQNFEVILCDDNSDDDTYNIAKNFCDKYPQKFKLLRNDKNMGLNYTLNKCLKVSKGDYIARMDGDDISLPRRFESQVKFLENNSEISIVSSNMVYFDENGQWGIGKSKKIPTKDDLVRGTPFAHAAAMVRKNAYSLVNNYSVKKRLLRVEDYHLWIKMYSKGLVGYNIQEPLYMMRDDKDARARRIFRYRINESYVKFLAIKMLKLKYWKIVYIFRPIIVGLLPSKIYMILHKNKLKVNDCLQSKYNSVVDSK